MAQIFFITGRNFSLSRAEIYSQIKHLSGIKTPIDTALIIDQADKFDYCKILKKLGGTIKVGRVISTVNSDQVLQKLAQHETLQQLLKNDNRVVFGLSSYAGKGGLTHTQIKAAGLNIKKIYKSAGQSARWVSSKENPLSSVVVTRNGLLKKGGEIVIIYDNDRAHLGQTLAVQDYQAYGLRDYGRPVRDMKQGLLPPKLAQILLNLAQVKPSDVLLDPFCGGGTILQEAWLQGLKNLFGSDINPQAVKNTRDNLVWLQNKLNLKPIKSRLFNQDVRQLKLVLPNNSVGAIVTEPYLGPVSFPRDPRKLKNVFKDLNNLYLNSFKVFSKILIKGGRVVIVFPRHDTKQQQYQVNIIKEILSLGFELVSYPSWIGQLPFTYSRSGQNVVREIYVFHKKM